MKKDAKIYLAGHRGLAGSAIFRELEQQGYFNILCKSHAELDLTRQEAVENFFRQEKPDYVFLAAAKVGGILGNETYPADFIYTNLAIQNHVIHAAYRCGVKRLLFLGSSCIYPRLCPQPMKEEYLMTGPLEATNAAYATAKIAGIEMCRSYNRQYGTQFIPVMPTNLYGINDNFDLQNSHVLPALIRKFHLAKLAQSGDWEGIRRDEIRFGSIPEDIGNALGYSPGGDNTKGGKNRKNPRVVLWGTGSPRREFLYADDLAHACVWLMNQENIPSLHSFLLNIGSGKDQTIRELAETAGRVTGYEGEVIWDREKPDGTPQKLLDISRIRKMGWQARIGLEEGMQKIWQWYCETSARSE
ncbi:MAG: GDP-L-fucose synthase [Desulfococcaceae bacterium]|jgi:GDP-L-fucose synthase|nr:GDP-L-fucose synthase [Desulfococcaceae bacterium]